ncbi:MAG: DUF5837 family cyanobactin class RiPP [Cyanobacteria bacterium P01_F01_bin.150]
MNKKTITPNPQQPVDRTPTGELPSALLLGLSEETLAGVVCCTDGFCIGLYCSFDGDDE